MDKMRMESPDIAEQNVEKIAKLFPNCMTEMKGKDGKVKRGINFELLKQMLSSDVVDGEESYTFTWVGKRDAIAEANKPIRKTLRPCKEESVNWDQTENLYIEGDNLDVLKLLQESYLAKIKMIYIDPPYNTGSDSFIYPDDYTMDKESYEEEIGLRDSKGTLQFAMNSNSNPRFHSDWCSMMYSRLILARNLLTEEGLIFISIDDNEIDNIEKICDEIFGAENFIAQCVWKSKPQGGNDNKYIVTEHEYILVYAKNISKVTIYGKPHEGTKYTRSDEYVSERGMYSTAKLDLSTLGYRINLDYGIQCPDKSIVYPGGVTKEEWLLRKNGGNKKRDWQWRWSKERFDVALKKGFVEFRKKNDKWSVYTKEYERMDYNGKPIERVINSNFAHGKHPVCLEKST